MRCKYGLVVLVFWLFVICPSSSKGQREDSSGIPSEKIAKQKSRKTKEREIHDRVEILRESYLRQKLLLPEEKMKQFFQNYKMRIIRDEEP